MRTHGDRFFPMPRIGGRCFCARGRGRNEDDLVLDDDSARAFETVLAFLRGGATPDETQLCVKWTWFVFLKYYSRDNKGKLRTCVTCRSMFHYRGGRRGRGVRQQAYLRQVSCPTILHWHL